MRICKHCKRSIVFDTHCIVHRDAGEWVTATAEVDGDIGNNVCEANAPIEREGVVINDPYSHEPIEPEYEYDAVRGWRNVRRKYTEQEIADINRRAREIARRGAMKHRAQLYRERLRIWWFPLAMWAMAGLLFAYKWNVPLCN